MTLRSVLRICSIACASIPSTLRADPLALLSRMTLGEKIGQLTQYSAGQLTGPGDRNESLANQRTMIRQGRLGSVINIMPARNTNELQHIAVQESRLHIPLLIGFDVIHGYRTTFPNPMAQACSWDLDLMQKTAAAAATEMAAEGVRWTFAPMVDITRDARWGRAVEGAGEDVFLGAKVAEALVRGFQTPNANGDWTVMATAKHFAAYGLPQGGLDYAGVDVSETTLRSVYLPPFAAAVKAGVGSVMASFSEVAGVPSTASRFLLSDILRKEWNYPGFVVSDWGSIDELVAHGYVASRADAAQAAIHSGCDMDMCSGTYDQELPRLMKSGAVPMSFVNHAVERVLRAKERLGLFAHPYADEALEAAAALRPETRALARQAALESMVLLKNEGNVLPLSKSTKRIALIGPFVDSTKDPLGCWPAVGKAKNVISLLQAVTQKLKGSGTELLYAQGTDVDGRHRDFAQAVSAAKKADVVVMYVGEPASKTGENQSRTSLDLSAAQTELIHSVHAAGKPIVLLLMNGGPISLPWEAEHIPAIVETWALGIESGNAIADILFGDESPSGHLVMTVPRNVGQVPIYYDHKPSGRPPGVDGGSRYNDSATTPLWTFGFGLSYTQFAFKNLSVSSPIISRNGTIKIEADVENIGSREGTEIPQIYIHDVAASLTRPGRELRGFTRLRLEAGETKHVSFSLGPAELGFWNQKNRFVVEPGAFEVWIGPNATEGLKSQFQVR